MLETILKNQGLTSREVSIYTLLLELGEQPASTIARKTKLSRSGCYTLLAQLAERGLTTQVQKNGVAFFAATDPAILLETAARKYHEEIGRINTMKQNLHFIRRQEAFCQPKSAAHYFQGETGLATLIGESLSHPAAVKRIYLGRNEFTRDLLNEQLCATGAAGTTGATRAANMTGAAGATGATEATKILTVSAVATATATDLPASCLTKKLPAAFDIGIDLIISGDRVALISLPENFGILIESRLIANAQSKIFDLVWRMARS